MRTTIVLVTIALVFALCVMGQAPNQPKPLNEDKSSSPPPQPSATGAHEMTAADVKAMVAPDRMMNQATSISFVRHSRPGIGHN